MNRKLLDGSRVPEFDIAVTLEVYTKCPAKWKLVDMETGEEYVGQLPREGQPYWKRIDA